MLTWLTSTVLVALSFLGNSAFAQAPVITSFSPASGPVEIEVTINGANFDASSIVYFGGIMSPSVIPISSTQLKAFVPIGANHGPISVTRAGLTGYSKEPYVITFGDGGVMTGCAFAAKRNLPTSSGPYAVAVADIDGDGKTDMLSANQVNGNFSVLRSLGMGYAAGSPVASFEPEVTFLTGADPKGIAVGDLDGDGKLDVVVSNSGSNTISIFRNISPIVGFIQFSSRVDLPAGVTPFKIAIRDLDLDGKPEIAVVNSGGTFGFSVYRNISSAGNITSGSFESHVDFVTGSNPEDIEITDIDGDGKPDVVTANAIGNSFSVLRNIAIAGAITTGSFSPKIDFASGSGTSRPQGITIGDVDLDGKTDVLVANNGNDAVSIFKNSSTTGNISFDPHSDIASGAGTNDVLLTDLDGDGKLDMAVSLQDASARGILTLKNISTSSIAFGFFNMFPSDTEPYQLLASDLDLDGRPDLTAGTPGSNGVAVFRNQVSSISTTPPLTGDFSPTSGPELSVVTLTGGPFSTSPLNNTVFFNGVRAHVFTATSTQLVVTVPSGATTGSISLTVGCQTAISVFPFTVTGGSCVPVAQRNLLVNLYNETGGTSWTNNSNWLSGDESTWFGVTVTGCTVTKLLLPNNNLDGELTTDLGSLFDLTELDLSHNQLYGNLPNHLYNAEDLVKISFADNQFYGGIPADWDGFGEFGILELLDLSNNTLDGSIPPGIGDLFGLKFLYLDHNQLEGSIPAQLSGLVALEEMTLDYNRFSSSVPTSFAALTKLKLLTASNNMLQTIEPGVGTLPIIEHLDFSYNFLSEVPTFTNPTINRLMLEHNSLQFDDLEQNIGVGGYTYNPQAKIPPGGTFTFSIGDPLSTPFSTGGTQNSYQWFKSGVSIPGQVSTNLSIPSMTINDAGFYTVQITSTLVPFITLESHPYLVLTDPCSGIRIAGDLDAGFDPHIDSPVKITNIERQSSGKIVASLSSGTTINSVSVGGLIRFNADGSLDNSFTMTPLSRPSARAMIVQPDDKIITTVFDSGAEVVRLNADGSEDIAFNFNTNSYYSGNIFSMALQPDGKILVAHDIYMSGPYIERLNANGTDDTSFSSPISSRAEVMVVQSDNKIIIGGAFGLVRLLPSGAIDGTFSTIVNERVFDIAMQPDGKIIAVGAFSEVNGVPHIGIVRVNSNGTIDNSFNIIGVTDDYELGHRPYKVALQSDGKVLVAGEYDNISGTNRRNITRLNSDGSMDCGFDPQISANDVIDDMFIQPDGKIVISGEFETYEDIIRNGLARINSGSGANITITLQPADVAVCPATPAKFDTNATGAANIIYQWQYAATTVFADISDNANYAGTNTKTLTVTTTGSFGAGKYRCRINGDLASEKITVEKTLSFQTLAKPAITTSNCTASSATLNGPAGFTSYTWSNGATTQQMTVNTAGTYSLIVKNAGGCVSPSSDATTFDSNFCNAAPVITTTSAQGTIQGTVVISLQSLISDPDNNIDISTLKIKTQPISGAIATISQMQLKVDYTGVSFSGKDQLTIEVCDVGGKCAQSNISIDIAGDLTVFTGISPNGDNINDFWTIEYIDVVPDAKENKVSLFNRWGDMVYEVNNYNNNDRVFKGIGKNGSQVPVGVYFYKIEFASGRKMLTGYLAVRY